MSKYTPLDTENQTLDQLEGVTWGPPAFESSLVVNVHRLRRVPLSQYRVEDLRLMISQEIGVPYLLPRALTHLEADPLVSGDYYAGDLFAVVARLPNYFWAAYPQFIPSVIRAIDAASPLLRTSDPDEEVLAELNAARDRLTVLQDAEST